MKNVIVFLFLGLQYACGQSITPFVINSTGGSGTNQSIILDFTMGEILSTTIVGSKNSICQGMLQTEVKMSGLKHVDGVQNKIFAYPNPTSDYLYFEGLKMDDIYSVCVYDSQGKIIVKNIMLNTNEIDISYLSSGIYFIALYDYNYNINFKVSKQ